MKMYLNTKLAIMLKEELGIDAWNNDDYEIIDKLPEAATDFMDWPPTTGPDDR